MFLLILIIYIFSILFYYKKVYWKDIPPVAKERFQYLAILIILIVSPIYLLRCILIEMNMNIFTKYYRFEYNIVDKTTKTILRTQTITVKRFWLQDVINDGFIEYCKGQLKDYECLSIKSVTRSSSVEFMEFKDCTIKETNERRIR